MPPPTSARRGRRARSEKSFNSSLSSAESIPEEVWGQLREDVLPKCVGEEPAAAAAAASAAYEQACSMESYAAWQGKMLQMSCIGLIFIAYATAVSKIKVESKGAATDAVAPTFTEDARFVSLIILSNVLPYVMNSRRFWWSSGASTSEGLEPWYGIALSVACLTGLRVSQITGLGGADQDWWQIGGGWVALTRWDVGGASLLVGHFVGGFMCGLVPLK
eukprot:5464009-Prymnesium_polylepis.1